MTRGTTIIMAIVLMLSLMVVVVPRATEGVTPTVTLFPDANLAPSEMQYVNGTDHPANVSVTLNLILPDGTKVGGVATGQTDTNGIFALSFTSPDRTGDGYIEAIVNGTNSYSILVKFVGLRTEELQVTLYPSTLKTNETARIEVKNDDLTARNYVITLSTTYPNGEITTAYYVLHDGLCNVERVYTLAGTYTFNVSIDGTSIYKKATATFIVGSTTDGGGTGTANQTTNITNITWYVTNTKNVYTIQIADNNGAYITSGTMYVKKPDATINTITLSVTGATFTAQSTGEYELTYSVGTTTFLKRITYSPTVSFRVSQFSSNGIATMTLTVDGSAPTESVTVEIVGANTETVQTELLESGSGSFTAEQPDSYAFTITYNGVEQTKYSTYTDTYIINSLTAAQSSDKSVLVVSGTLVGEKSSRGISNTLVKIQIDYLGYLNNVRTSTDGTFRVSISLPSEKRGDWIGGTVVEIKAQYGVNDASTTTTKLEHDFWSEYGWLLGLGLVVVLGMLWVTGILTWLTKGKIPKPFDGNGGGGGGAWGARKGGSYKTLQPANIELRPPKQMGLS